MSQQEIKIDWLDKMAFSTRVNGHEIILDASEEGGGDDRGPRPKGLMLVALAGCTGMDVISILKKMRVDVEAFSVRVVGDLTEEHPKHFTELRVIYEFKGKDLPMDKLQKAIDLSQERYCGVSTSFRKGMAVATEIAVVE
jgi:putative redox protein